LGLLAAVAVVCQLHTGVAQARTDPRLIHLKAGAASSVTQPANTDTLTVAGRLTLDQPAIAASFESTGVVKAIHVSPGQAVKKGDALAELDGSDLNNALAQAQEQLALKQAELAHGDAPPSRSEINRAKRELAAAQSEYERQKSGGTQYDIEQALHSWNKDKNSLWSDQLNRDETCGLTPGSSTEEDFKQANLDLECKKKTLDVQIAELAERTSYQAYLDAQKPGTEAAIAQAWANVAQAKASLAALQRGPSAGQAQINAIELSKVQLAVDRAQRDLGKAKLVSPCDCIVQRVGLSVGTRADGDITLLDISELTFQASAVSERDVVRIESGQPVTVRLNAGAPLIPGRVHAVLPLPSGSQGDTASYAVNIDLDELEGVKLLPGMTGQADIQLTPEQTTANASASVAAGTAMTGPVVTASGIVALSVLTSTPGFAQPGKVVSITVRAGQAVKKGDVLAMIDDVVIQDAIADAQLELALANLKAKPHDAPTSKEDIAAAQAALAAAEAGYAATKAGPTQSEMDNAKRSVDSAWLSYLGAQISRDVHCGTDEGLEAHECKTEEASFGNTYESWAAALDSYNKLLAPVDEDKLAQANEAVISAREKLAALKSPASKTAQDVVNAEIASAEATLARAQSNLAKATLLSPCDCIVQQVNVAVDVKAPDDAFVLVDLTHMQFVINLAEGDVARVQADAPATIQLNAFAQPFTGRVKATLAQSLSRGDDDGDGDSALFTILLDIDPTDKRLLPGMAGRADVATP
jgi:multidrug efflux pump subunit AcrA (membrane-fusion protein)